MSMNPEFISNSEMLTVDDVLTVVVEEGAEVIKAAAKCMRFGFQREYLDEGPNHEALAKEVGDLLGMVDELGLNQTIIAEARAGKLGKVLKWKAERNLAAAEALERMAAWAEKVEAVTAVPAPFDLSLAEYKQYLRLSGPPGEGMR